MVTAVWGDWHINAHVTVNLPTLLAHGNLPELARRCEVTYRVYTRRSDVVRLMASSMMQEVSRLMPLEVETLSEERLTNPIAAHQWAWGQAIRDAKESDRFILFLPPDVAWADGSFTGIADLLEAGKKAVLMTYLRVVVAIHQPLRREPDVARGVEKHFARQDPREHTLAAHGPQDHLGVTGKVGTVMAIRGHERVQVPKR